MYKSSRFLVATALASIIGLSTMVPVTYAQDAPAAPTAPAITQPDDNGGMRPDDGMRGPGGPRGGDVAGITCATDGATQLETTFSDIATKLALTATQQPLFDAYRTATLTAQTAFAEACAKTQPAAPTAGTQPTPPDALTMLKDRQAHQTAELDALNAVLPSFEALYNTLSDQQKVDILPLVGPHHGPGDHGPRGDQHGDQRDDRGPGRDDHRDDHRGDNRGGRDGRQGMNLTVTPDVAPVPATAG